MLEGQILVDGDWREASGGATIAVVNPSDGAELRRDRARHRRGHRCGGQGGARGARWRLGPDAAPFERGRILARLGRLVARTADELARARGAGHRQADQQARADALALARYFEFYGGAADKVHGETIPYQDGYTVFTLREPHGVTGHIIPWNYPMQIFGRSVGGALATGNACVVKPGEDACLTVLEVGRAGARGRLAAGRAQHRDRATATRRAPRSPPIPASTTSPSPARARSAPGPAGGGRARLPGDARARRQVARRSCSPMPTSTRRCRSRQRRDPERRPDLLGRLAPAGRGQRLRRRSSAQVAERFHTLGVGPAEMDLDCGPLIRATSSARRGLSRAAHARTAC